ncbi:nucleotidyltransferase [Erysipelothrix rhusiopathiae]|nr:nucleotidyltransferase [Erysipelothrix rhusiopathiae]
MYDCSKEFNEFYRKKVVLPAKKQNELRQKRKLNIKRIKSGLLEYNAEKNTNYKISEERIQGSMAMHTITQNDENDYDIDVGIVFESDNLDQLGPLATRNMVANALERKTNQFAKVPDVKTSCVRLKYSFEGYHVDFAVFKRYKHFLKKDEYIYEHAGSEWSIRHLKALEEWFNEEIKNLGDDLRKITRLSKMFCKSRDSWRNMPSGLIQTIVCNENLFTNSTRLDESFYFTMKAIVSRLNTYLEVHAPVDNKRALVTRETDYQSMKKWKSRLDSNLANLDILFDTKCTYKEALNAWAQFFNHSYWNELYSSTRNESFGVGKAYDFDDTEEFIEDLYPIYEQYDVTIDCRVSGNGFSAMPILDYLDKLGLRSKSFIPHNFSIKCKIGYTNCPSFDKILWKVLNVGSEAERRNNIRGQIFDKGSEISENSKFLGEHFIECYLIKNGICVAIGHVDVPIGGN